MIIAKRIYVNCIDPLFHAVAQAVVVAGDSDRRTLSNTQEDADRLITDDPELAKSFDAECPNRGRGILIITSSREQLKEKLAGFHGSIIKWADGNHEDSRALNNTLVSGGM